MRFKGIRAEKMDDGKAKEIKPVWDWPDAEGWFTCNECGSLGSDGRLRKFKCRTTNPVKFNLCDQEALRK